MPGSGQGSEIKERGGMRTDGAIIRHAASEILKRPHAKTFSAGYSAPWTLETATGREGGANILYIDINNLSE
jgi:hypothetical protein